MFKSVSQWSVKGKLSSMMTIKYEEINGKEIGTKKSEQEKMNEKK